MKDSEILSTTPAWRAAPWAYNSCVYLTFHPDGSGEMCFGYGQTIYGEFHFTYEIAEPGTLLLNDFTLSGGSASFDSTVVRYRLVQSEEDGYEPNGGPYAFQWTLEFEHSPFPKEFHPTRWWQGKDPLVIPTKFYGHRENRVTGRAIAPPERRLVEWLVNECVGDAMLSASYLAQIDQYRVVECRGEGTLGLLFRNTDDDVDCVATASGRTDDGIEVRLSLWADNAGRLCSLDVESKDVTELSELSLPNPEHLAPERA